MSLGWSWRPKTRRTTEISRLETDDFLDVILGGYNNPIIVDRLNMFFESDPLILIRVRENPSVNGRIILVSKDKKLAARIIRFVWGNRSSQSRVYLVDPVIFFLGRIDEIPHDFLLEDAGSLNFFGRNASSTNYQLVECNPLVYTSEERYRGVISVTLKDFSVKLPKRANRVGQFDPNLKDKMNLVSRSAKDEAEERMRDVSHTGQAVPVSLAIEAVSQGVRQPLHPLPLSRDMTWDESFIQSDRDTSAFISMFINAGMKPANAVLQAFTIDCRKEQTRPGAQQSDIEYRLMRLYGRLKERLSELGVEPPPPPYNG
jgi:hypothetical protein